MYYQFFFPASFEVRTISVDNYFCTLINLCLTLRLQGDFDNFLICLRETVLMKLY